MRVSRLWGICDLGRKRQQIICIGRFRCRLYNPDYGANLRNSRCEVRFQILPVVSPSPESG